MKYAEVTAETELVTPGPAVTTASPGRRVSLAVPSAANVAVCSCRTSTIRSLLPYGRVVDREDVAAGQREHLLDARRPQRRQRDVAAVPLDGLHAGDPTDR